MAVTIDGSNTPTAGGVGYGDGSELAFTSAGTAGQVLTSNGSSAPTWGAGPSGTGGATASGNVTLTSASSGAQAITTTNYGQTVTLPNATTMSKGAMLFNIKNAGGYVLKILNFSGSILGFVYPNEAAMVGLADNSTSDGVWTLVNTDIVAMTASNYFASITNLSVVQSLVIDSSRLLFIFGQSSTNLYGLVFNKSSNTWGTPTLIRTSAGANRPLLIGTDKVLICSCSTSSTAFEAVVLSLSGTTISVGTPATATFGTNLARFFNFIAVGSTYAVAYSLGGNSQIIAMTVSGTTVTLGSPVTFSIGSTIANACYLYAVSASVLLCVFVDSISSTISGNPYSVSSSTLTLGTPASASCSAATTMRTSTISSGARYLAITYTSTPTIDASIFTFTGTTATISQVNTGLTNAANGGYLPASTSFDMCVSGSKALIFATNQCNIITDTSGVATAGTALSLPASNLSTSSPVFIKLDGSTAIFWYQSTATTGGIASRLDIDISGSSPAVLSVNDYAVFPTTGGVMFSGVSTSATPYDQSRPYQWTIGSTVAVSLQGGSGSFYYASSVITKNSAYTLFSKVLFALSTNSGSNTAVGHSSSETWVYVSNLGSGSVSGGLFRYEVVA